MEAVKRVTEDRGLRDKELGTRPEIRATTGFGARERRGAVSIRAPAVRRLLEDTGWTGRNSRKSP
jgi:hypothetical protein